MIKIRDNSGSVITVPTLKGTDGKSAYEYAKEAGFEGTEQEFINLLIDATDIINDHMSDDGAHADIRELVENSNSSLEETKESIGDLNELDTFHKEDLVSAVNEVKQSLENINILAGAVVINEDYSDDTIQKKYILRQNDAIIGSIDIPKDMVIRSGAVVVDPINQEPGTYLQLSISNVNDPVYINISSVTNTFNTNETPDKIKIEINKVANTIDATIVPGAVTTEELADGSVTNNKIVDGTITNAKLATNIQQSLAKIDIATTYAKSYTDTEVGKVNILINEVSDDLDAEIERATAAEAKALTDAKSYVDTKFDAIIGEGASTTLDTIGEISKAIEDHKDVTDALNTAIGNKVDKVSGKGLSTNDYTTEEKNKLAGITTTNAVTQNSTALFTSGGAYTALANKVDKVSGKGLSTNDYTTDDKNKLTNIAAGAEVNQNAFSNVVVGSTTIAADSKTDTLTLVAGSNVAITPDATNDKITIAMSIPVNPTAAQISALPVGGMYIIS